jgi:hypothetical protein
MNNALDWPWLARAVACENAAVTFGALASEYQAERNLSEAARLRDNATWMLRKAKGYRAKHMEQMERRAREAA